MRKIWDNYDGDHSGIMEFAEFKQFINELNIKIEGLTPEELFKRIDIDKSGKIDFQEFVKYYRELTSGKEFQPFFEIYSSDKKTLSIEEFKKFMLEVQKPSHFNDIDAIQLFIEFCENMPKEVKEIFKKKLDDDKTKEYLESLQYPGYNFYFTKEYNHILKKLISRN